MKSATESEHSRLGDAATVVQTIIKEPVREAVREALEEKRQQEHTETIEIPKSDESSSGGRRVGRIAGVVAGLATAAYLVRRRRRQEESPREPVSGTSSMKGTGVETGRPAEAGKQGPEDETDFGTETSRESDDDSDISVGER